jgi:hypothetical protein
VASISIATTADPTRGTIALDSDALQGEAAGQLEQYFTAITPATRQK